MAVLPPRPASANKSIRRVLAPLARMAEQLNLAVVGVMHINRRAGVDATERINGSGAFGNAARSVLMLGHDPEDPDGDRATGRVLAQCKCNLGPKRPSILLRVEPRTITDGYGEWLEASRIIPVGESHASADDLVAGSEERSAAGDARRFLRELLADGPILA